MGQVYTVAVVVHAAMGAALMGSIITEPLLRSTIRNARSGIELRMWLGFERRSNASHPPLALILLGTGIYLGTFGWWDTAWFAVAVLLWIANTALALTVLDRRAHAVLVRLAGGNGSVDREIDKIRRSSAWDWAVAAMSANDVASLYLMFAKPGAIGSVLTVVVMQASVASGLIYWIRRAGTQEPQVSVTVAPS